MTRVLVVDDEPQIVRALELNLRARAYDVDAAGDGATALRLVADRYPDVVVLDLGLPDMDGVEVLRRLRGWTRVPVLVLSARHSSDEKVQALDAGADDYVTKPFSPRELVLRVESVLRRSRPSDAAPGARPAGGLLQAAGLRVDPAARRAAKEGTELALTVREFDLLTFFLRHPGRAFGREELMREVWGWDFGDLSTVTVHVRRLRGKIEDDPARPRLIQTVWGIGYRLDAGPSGTLDAGAQGADGTRAQDR